jgi:predicted acyltransferase (DUF342 family)
MTVDVRDVPIQTTFFCSSMTVNARDVPIQSTSFCPFHDVLRKGRDAEIEHLLLPFNDGLR